MRSAHKMVQYDGRVEGGGGLATRETKSDVEQEGFPVEDARY